MNTTARTATVLLALTATLGACTASGPQGERVSTHPAVVEPASHRAGADSLPSVDVAPAASGSTDQSTADAAIPASTAPVQEFPGEGARLETTGDVAAMTTLPADLRAHLGAQLGDVQACGPTTILLTSYRADGWAAARLTSTECADRDVVWHRTGSSWAEVRTGDTPA